jgi:hypothetical protein
VSCCQWFMAEFIRNTHLHREIMRIWSDDRPRKFGTEIQRFGDYLCVSRQEMNECSLPHDAGEGLRGIGLPFRIDAGDRRRKYYHF